MAIELATAEPAEPENLRGVDATLAIRLGDAHAIAQESARNRVDERSEEKDPRRQVAQQPEAFRIHQIGLECETGYVAARPVETLD